ncbi:MAG: hypothetical protein WC700_17330 [Gemmatimonadaceae bacterium]|jgi:hypothetical protein
MTVRCVCHYRCIVRDCRARVPHVRTPDCDITCVHVNGINFAVCVPCDDHGNINTAGRPATTEEHMGDKNAMDYAAEKREQSLARLKASETLADLDREIALIKLGHEAHVANDPTHSNDAKRKAALAARVANDGMIDKANAQRTDLAHTIAVAGIDINYCDDMIKALTTK